MPWSFKQLKLFRAAAHNPAIAKERGLKQAGAERMSKEGLKMAAGGKTRQKINNPDTKHGLLDLPVANLSKYRGMAGGGRVHDEPVGFYERTPDDNRPIHPLPKARGGSVKKRRFAEGGEVDRKSTR